MSWHVRFVIYRLKKKKDGEGLQTILDANQLKERKKMASLVKANV